MGRKVKQFKNYTTEQVEALFESDENNIVGVRMYAIIQLTRDYSTRQLEDFYRVTHKQICNWADRFDAEGIDGLRMKPGRGRHPYITSGQKEQLKTDLSKTPETFGYNTASWSGPLLKKHLETAYGIVYKQAAVYVLLHNLGFSFQRARGKYPERDEAKREQAKSDIKKR
ncbi:MAG: winged helix-turn-helix domain-containing protein [Prevotellaceae bacterium]|jgi:transposase|nr:winged helix-turn-helix domain-containing protein [Prevotellaceae bacterium]